MKKTIRIATRKSRLALWQSEHIKNSLLTINPDLNIVLIGVTTEGDRQSNQALTQLGGKSLFVKELQKALRENKADIAVHSIKDMSVQESDDLCLAAVGERDDPRDALVSQHFYNLHTLPKGAIVGTASPRRTALLKSLRPDLHIKLLRGNVDTRIHQCENGEYDAIVLAVAGLKRLNLADRITEYLDPTIFIPAIGQAAIGVECREKDWELRDLLKTINHEKSSLCIRAERVVNQILGGDCYSPIAAHATIQNNCMKLCGMVGSLDGSTILRAQAEDEPKNAMHLSELLAHQLLEQGAKSLLHTIEN